MVVRKNIPENLGYRPNLRFISWICIVERIYCMNMVWFFGKIRCRTLRSPASLNLSLHVDFQIIKNLFSSLLTKYCIIINWLFEILHRNKLYAQTRIFLFLQNAFLFMLKKSLNKQYVFFRHNAIRADCFLFALWFLITYIPKSCNYLTFVIIDLFSIKTIFYRRGWYR